MYIVDFVPTACDAITLAWFDNEHMPLPMMQIIW